MKTLIKIGIVLLVGSIKILGLAHDARMALQEEERQAQLQEEMAQLRTELDKERSKSRIEDLPLKSFPTPEPIVSTLPPSLHHSAPKLSPPPLTKYDLPPDSNRAIDISYGKLTGCRQVVNVNTMLAVRKEPIRSSTAVAGYRNGVKFYLTGEAKSNGYYKTSQPVPGWIAAEDYSQNCTYHKLPHANPVMCRQVWETQEKVFIWDNGRVGKVLGLLPHTYQVTLDTNQTSVGYRTGYKKISSPVIGWVDSKYLGNCQ